MIDLKTGKEFGTSNIAYDNIVRKLKRGEAMFGIGNTQLCGMANSNLKRGASARTIGLPLRGAAVFSVCDYLEWQSVTAGFELQPIEDEWDTCSFRERIKASYPNWNYFSYIFGFVIGQKLLWNGNNGAVLLSYQSIDFDFWGFSVTKPRVLSVFDPTRSKTITYSVDFVTNRRVVIAINSTDSEQYTWRGARRGEGELCINGNVIRKWKPIIFNATATYNSYDGASRTLAVREFPAGYATYYDEVTDTVAVKTGSGSVRGGYVSR